MVYKLRKTPRTTANKRRRLLIKVATDAHELLPNARLKKPMEYELHEESAMTKRGFGGVVPARKPALHAGHVLLHFQSSVGTQVPTVDFTLPIPAARGKEKSTRSSVEVSKVLNALHSGYIVCEAHGISLLTAIQALTRRIALSDKKDHQLVRVVWNPPLPWLVTRDAPPAPARLDVYLCSRFVLTSRASMPLKHPHPCAVPAHTTLHQRVSV